jgi:hypothetical protein
MANISTKASRITHQIDDEAKIATHEKITHGFDFGHEV